MVMLVKTAVVIVVVMVVVAAAEVELRFSAEVAAVHFH